MRIAQASTPLSNHTEAVLIVDYGGTPIGVFTPWADCVQQRNTETESVTATVAKPTVPAPRPASQSSQPKPQIKPYVEPAAADTPRKFKQGEPLNVEHAALLNHLWLRLKDAKAVSKEFTARTSRILGMQTILNRMPDELDDAPIGAKKKAARPVATPVSLPARADDDDTLSAAVQTDQEIRDSARKLLESHGVDVDALINGDMTAKAMARKAVARAISDVVADDKLFANCASPSADAIKKSSAILKAQNLLEHTVRQAEHYRTGPVPTLAHRAHIGNLPAGYIQG